MINRDIKRVDKISETDFVLDHLNGFGEPIIITDFAKNWKAGSKWSFSYFLSKFGDDFIKIPLNFRENIGSKLTKLRCFIEHMDDSIENIPGFWLSKEGKPLRYGPKFDPELIWSAGWDAFIMHPELLDDITPRPSFIPDLVENLSESVKKIMEQITKKDFLSIYISKARTITYLHQDHSHTHGYLVQFHGNKEVIMFSPDQSHLLYDGKVDPENVDFNRFPLLRKSTSYSCIMRPGDLLFIPSRWWHYTKSLESSITLSYNFFNKYNISEYLEDVFVRAMRS